MASRNTSAAASNESAIAPLPSPSLFRSAVPNKWSGRRPECGDPDSGTTGGGILGAKGDCQTEDRTQEAVPSASLSAEVRTPGTCAQHKPVAIRSTTATGLCN